MFKDNFWQGVRGFCILAVILIHCKHDYSVSSSFNFNYGVILRQLINFPVAIFFFLSGYFLNLSRIKSSWKSFYKTRITRVLLPFIFWSVFYTSFSILKDPSSFDFFNTLFKIVIGKAAGPLYFLVVLLQLIVITPWLIDIVENKNSITKKLLWFLTPAYLIVLYIVQLYFNLKMPLYETWFPAWFLFYYLGINIKSNSLNTNKKIFNSVSFKKPVFFVLIGLLLSLLEAKSLILLGAPSSFAISQIKISSFLYAFSIIILLLQLNTCMHSVPSVLKKIGDASFGIYLIHPFWLSIFKVFSVSVGLNILFLPFYQLLQLLFVLVLSMVSIQLTKKILPNKFSQVLGF